MIHQLRVGAIRSLPRVTPDRPVRCNTMTSPVRDEDRLDINVSDTAVIDLASLATIGGSGQTRFSVTGGAVQFLPALQSVSGARFDVNGGGN